MSIIIWDGDSVRKNTANKKELRLPKSRMDDTVKKSRRGFGGNGTINCKKYEEDAKKSPFYRQKATWR